MEHGTEAAATAYHDYESGALETHAADIDAHGGIFVIHDWRVVTTYDKGARHIWQERMKARPRDIFGARWSAWRRPSPCCGWRSRR